MKSKLQLRIEKRNEAIRWLKERIWELKHSGPYALTKTKHRIEKKFFFIGKMYFFFYDPKTKEKMKYYDTFPLVIPISFHNDGFLGINFHYLPVPERLRLLNNLTKLVNNTRYDETTRMRVTYEYLKRFAKYKRFEPCLKKYLFDHVQSKFVQINSYEWFTAVALPFERFKKESTEVIWKESMDKVNN